MQTSDGDEVSKAERAVNEARKVRIGILYLIQIFDNVPRYSI